MELLTAWMPMDLVTAWMPRGFSTSWMLHEVSYILDACFPRNRVSYLYCLQEQLPELMIFVLCCRAGYIGGYILCSFTCD